MTRMALALGAVVALLACGSAQASDTFRVTAGGDQNWGPTSGALDQTASTPLDRTGTMSDSGNAVGSVDYHLQAGPGIARASLDGHVTVPSALAYPFNPSVQAVANTELTINGPTPEVNASLNLHVDGVIESTVCPGPPCGTLSIFINAPTGTTAGRTAEFNARGETRVNDLGLAFDAVPGGYRVHGDVTSPVIGLTTGTPHALGIVLNIGGRFGGNPGGESFRGSADDPDQRWQVSFAPSGPVLNLPAGYSVSGSSVVNNRWDDPFAGDTVVTDCNDPSLAQMTTIPGSLVLRCNTATFPNLTHIGGDVVIDGDHAPHVAFPGPVIVDGSVRVVGNSGGGDLDIHNGSVAGTVDVSGNGGDLNVGIGSAAGTVDISGTGGDLNVGIGSAAGTVDISGTGGDLDVDPGTVGGDLDVSDNPDADVINAGGGQIGGDLTVTDNGTVPVNANDSLAVSGDADVETGGGGLLDLSGVDVDGDETVAAGGDAVTANTAGGTTDVSILGGTAAMHVVLPDRAFDQPVAFTITRRGNDPAEGVIDPLAGYAFAFAVPTLNADARLAFTIDLAALEAGTRAALLAGIASGSATIVSKADAPGSPYSAFARCTGTQTPAADGCVTVTVLAADGTAAPAGTEPALARFDGIAGHFSTYAVALVGTRPGPSAGPTAAQIRALLRTEITPRGKAGKIRALLERGYRLPFRALTAGTAKVGWYRLRKGRKPTLIASGRHRFAAAGTAIVAVKLTKAGRRQLRRVKHVRLTARGTFTPASGTAVTAARRFTLRR